MTIEQGDGQRDHAKVQEGIVVPKQSLEGDPSAGQSGPESSGIRINPKTLFGGLRADKAPQATVVIQLSPKIKELLGGVADPGALKEAGGSVGTEGAAVAAAPESTVVLERNVRTGLLMPTQENRQGDQDQGVSTDGDPIREGIPQAPMDLDGNPNREAPPVGDGINADAKDAPPTGDVSAGRDDTPPSEPPDAEEPGQAHMGQAADVTSAGNAPEHDQVESKEQTNPPRPQEPPMDPEVRKKAFEDELLGKYDNLFALMLTKHGGTIGRDDVEVLVQSAVTNALASQNEYTLGTNMFAWLGTIADNLYKSTYRQQQRRQQIVWREDVGDTTIARAIDRTQVPVDDQAINGTYKTSASLTANLVRSLETIMDSNHARVYVATNVLGFKYEETAQVLSDAGIRIRPGTVASGKSRAHDSLFEAAGVQRNIDSKELTKTKVTTLLGLLRQGDYVFTQAGITDKDKQTKSSVREKIGAWMNETRPWEEELVK